MNAHFPDGSLTPHERAGAGLNYPFPTPPAAGAAIRIAEGVHWLRLPLPLGLDHINIWALEDAGCWTIVDTGMGSDPSIAIWQALLVGVLDSRPIRRVIGTHMHPDHIGMAGWLADRFDCRLWMSRSEYLTCRMLVADTGREAPAAALRFYRAAGWDDTALDQYMNRFGSYGRRIHRLPEGYRRVIDGEDILIGGRHWKVIVGRGHSPEHVCLYSAASRLLISGDQVLPLITSNVSVHPFEPEADPLADWLVSLEMLKYCVSDEVLVLPSHNLPFRGLHARLIALERRHERSLAALLAALNEPKRAVDVFPVLFRRAVDPGVLGAATGESLAHLNYLILQGNVEARMDADGVRWYYRR